MPTLQWLVVAYQIKPKKESDADRFERLVNDGQWLEGDFYLDRNVYVNKQVKLRASGNIVGVNKPTMVFYSPGPCAEGSGKIWGMQIYGRHNQVMNIGVA